jgi:hypothetical protein
VGQSLAQKVASLPEEQQAEILDGMDQEKLLHDWSF